MHAPCSRSANVASAVINLKEGAHVDHGQTLVVQHPIIHGCIAEIHRIRCPHIHATVGASLVGDADHAFAGNGAGGPILPGFPCIVGLQNFVARLGSRQHAPQPVRVGPIHVEVNGTVVVVPVFHGCRTRGFPRRPSIARSMDAPHRAIQLLRHVQTISVARTYFDRHDFLATKIVNQRPRGPCVLRTPQLRTHGRKHGVVAGRIPFQVAVLAKPIPGVGVLGIVERQAIDAVKAVRGVAEGAAIVVPTRRITRIDKAAEVVAGQFGEPATSRVSLGTPMVQVAIANHRAVVVSPANHDLRTAPPSLPSPEIRSMDAVHAGLHVVALVGRVEHAPVRRHPQIDRPIGTCEELHVMHVRVGVPVCRELSSPGDPVGVQRPIHASIFRSPNADSCGELTVRVGGTHVQGEVVVVLPAVARAVFAPPQDVGVGAGFPRTAWTVAAAREFERLAGVQALVHPIEAAPFRRLARRQHDHAVGVGGGHGNFATALFVARPDGRPTHCARLERQATVGGTLELGRLVQQLHRVTHVRIGGMELQFHVFPARHLRHRGTAIVASVQSVVRGRKEHGTVRARAKRHVAVPPVV